MRRAADDIEVFDGLDHLGPAGVAIGRPRRVTGRGLHEPIRLSVVQDDVGAGEQMRGSPT